MTTLSQMQDEAIDHPQPQKQLSQSTTQSSMEAAFELIWQEFDPITQRVGLLLTLFAPTMFLWQWVEMMSQLLSWDHAVLNRARKQLCDRQFIQPVDEREDGYKLCPLIREFLREKLEEMAPLNSFSSDSRRDGGELRQAFVAVILQVAEQISDSPTYQTIELVQDAIPHLEEVARHWTALLREEDVLWLLDRLGRFYQSQGMYSLAEPWLEKCLVVARASLGDDHLDVATSLNNLAGLYYSQKRYGEAEPLLLEALVLRKRFLGKYHPDVATSLNNLAGLYHSQGRYREAESLLSRVLELRKHLLGENHSDVAATLNNLASLYESQERYSEAEPLYLKALELRKQVLGNAHPDVATTLNNLAGLYYAQKRYNEAEPLYEEAFELSKRVLGDKHHNTSIFHKNLSILRAKKTSNMSWLRTLTRKIFTFM